MKYTLKQVYVNENVVDAAQKRIKYIFDEFENITVSVSGGKDSTVLAWLALHEAHKRGRRIGIFFLDEEVVYQSTIEQVQWIMDLFPENTIKIWFQFPFRLTNATSLTETQLVCWEEGKHKIWMRPKLPFAVQHIPWDKNALKIRDKNKGFGFYDVLRNFQDSRDHTAFLVGLRGQESPNRWRAVSKNPGYKDVYWSTRCGGEGSASFYPLYDWNFHDIWKFIYDNHIRYSRIYDYQWKKGLPQNEIRVSSLIHEKAFKSLVELPEFEPKTYDKLLKRVKGIQVGNLYGRDEALLKCRKLPKNYNSWRDYRDFLMETYPDQDKKWIFERRFAKYLDNEYVARQECRQLLLNDYENNLPVDNDRDPREKTIEKWKNILME